MITLELLEAAGAIGTGDVRYSLLPYDREIVMASEDRFAVGGVASIWRFEGQRHVAEFVGSFSYAVGPEDVTTPYDGSVDALNIYMSNRTIATIEFDETRSWTNFWGRFDRDFDRGGVEVIGNSFNNELYGGWRGEDVLRGGAGDDSLWGGDGDELFGGAGDDSFYLEGGAEVHEQEGEGTDTVIIYDDRNEYTLGENLENLVYYGWNDSQSFTGFGNVEDNELVGARYFENRLLGWSGNDVLKGGRVGDELVGGTGDDGLNGRGGEDVLIGGLGVDVIAGGKGGDRFVWRNADESGVALSADTLEDFVSGEDTIDVKRVDADSTVDGNQSFTWIGSSVFSGTAGEIGFDGTSMSADLNGDGIVDLEIRFAEGTSVAEADVLL